jgi:hypothetical protein
MANFTLTNSTAIGAGNVQQALSATYKSMIVMGNSSATGSTVGAGMFRRGKLYDILIGTNTTPADNFLEFDVTRATLSTTPAGTTTLGVSSVSSTFGLDPADNNGTVNWLQINSTAEVGIAATTEVWYVGINQRASYRWVAAPGSELIWPAVSSATASGALSVRARSAAYTGTATVTALFQEQ